MQRRALSSRHSLWFIKRSELQALSGKVFVRTAKVVLLVDDLESDLLLMKVAFGRAKVRHPIQEAVDGQQAIDYLSGAGVYADRDRYPEVCVVITDLKMPKVDGFELLGWLRERSEFNRLPRVVLTASGLEEDRRRAAELGCCEYLVKPTGFERLIEVAEHLDDAWIEAHCPSAGKS